MNTSQPQPQLPTDADLELLSAYIDNQLSVAERVGLEQRLRAEPLLRAELADLQATTELLRTLEPVRPPRSFTLDPATAPRRVRFFPFAWVMQLGSGLAGMALVLLASVQLLTAPVMSPAMESAPAPMAAQGGDMSAAAVPAATEAPAEAREAQPQSPPDAAMTMIEESAPVEPTLPPNAGGPPSIDNPAAANPAADAAPADATMQAYAAPPEEAAGKLAPAPAPGLPPMITLTLGVVLLAAAAGAFVYGRLQR